MHTSFHSTGEHRFISYALDSSIKYNRRNAEINAANQAAQRQAQVTANQQLISQNPQGLSPNQSNIAPIVTGVPKKALNVSGYQSYDPSTGKITVAAPLGAIDESAVKRLMGSGMTEGEARDRVNALRPAVRNTMSNTGLYADGESVAGAPLTAEQYADSIVSSLGDPRLVSTEAKAEARQQALQTFYEKQRADEEMKRNISERNQRQMSSVGYNQNAVNDRLASRLTKLEGTRGDFVDQKRAEINPKTGKIFTDKEIKSLLQGLPVGTFSNEQAPQQQTQSQTPPAPVEPQSPPPPASVTPQVSKTPTDGTETTKKDETSQGSQEQPQAPIYPPQASAVRDMMTKLAKDNPLVGLYAAMYDEDVMRTEQAKANALLSLDASIQGAEQEDLDTQAYIDKWVNIANQNSSKLTGILQSNNEETNKILEEQKNNALQKLEFDRQVQTQQMEKQKAADVLKSSIAIGLRGGAYSGAAQNALAESEREWDTAIQNLGKEYSFKAADVMTDYTSKYVTAKQNLALNLFQASEALQNKIEGYANAGFSSLQAKKKAITEARNDYRSTLDTLAKDHATNLKSYVKEMGDMVNKKRDDERAQEQLGINMLDKLVDTYGNNVPPSLLETVKKYIPNIDIQDVMKRRTLAQMKKGAGGVGGGVGGGVSPVNATIASLYTNITPQQLKEAVKRAFSPQNYGGTDKERLKRENEYMSRIASGESPESIIQSLGSDYWSSQKGAQRTMHTERVTAQGSAESLQEFVNYYGIKAGDDGPLGAIDSRVQALASVFGLSSEEYNNLATNVGNIRARIVKENYGAAVTPQELNLAKSYIPSMTDKGAQFVTKLQNLKSYQAYLDAKVLADSLGLPMPKPPSPVTLSGDKISGPSKFSVEDITSTLSE